MAAPLSAGLRLTGMCRDADAESGLAPKMLEMREREMAIANVCVFQSTEMIVCTSSEAKVLQASELSAG